MTVSAFAPGRVNLIGEHTDYTGGLALPMAIDLGTTVTLEPGGGEVVLHSETEDEPAVVPLDVGDPSAVAPPWARYVAGVVAELRPERGGVGSVRTTLPIGAGLSSSAALEVAVALALGFEGSPAELAQLCQRAEQRSSGVPSGVLDQFASAAGVAGSALLLDCATLSSTPVPLPDGVDVVVVHSGQSRRLAGSAYADRRASCEAAEVIIGPLRSADAAAVERIPDPVLRRRARHVVSENARVRAFATCLADGDVVACGRLLAESHASLRDDFEVSTPVVDALVVRLSSTPGVFGARIMGGGFGGAVLALTQPGALDVGWTVRAVDGARLMP